MPPARAQRRIAYLTHVAQLSGAEIGLLRFLQATDDIDATVLVAEDGPLVPALREAGATVEVVPLPERARSLTRAQVGRVATDLDVLRTTGSYVRCLSARLRALAPDVVHTNSLKAGIYGTAAARLAGLPTVWHLHDRLEPDYLPAHVVAPLRLAATTAPTALVAPSRMALRTAGRGGRPGLHRAVVPLPIPVPAEPARIRDEVRRVGIVGRLTPWKGQHVFLDAFARAFPTGDVRGVVLGSAVFGEDDYARTLEEQARRLGIAERIDFLGFREDVESEMRELDVVVHASVLADPLTTVVFEGLALGLPVVATSRGGHVEHVRHGHEALLHEPGDAGSLAAQLRRLADDGALRRHLAATGRRKAASFAPGAVVGDMLDLYERVLA